MTIKEAKEICARLECYDETLSKPASRNICWLWVVCTMQERTLTLL